MLVGRTEALARLDWVVSGARAGRGGALLLQGEPGSGKTALLAAAAERADGMTVLRCVGAQDERELPYAGLHALLRRLGPQHDALVPTQQDALDLALGVVAGGRPSPLVLATAVLGLLDAAADVTPVLVLVDDLQWIDQESRDVLGFIARRVTDSAIGLVAAARPGPVTLASVEVHEVADLGSGGALELLGGLDVAPSVAAELVARVGGNPLALVELVRRLDPAQCRGTAVLPDPLPATGPGAAYVATLAALPDEARLAAGTAAVAGPVTPQILATALGLLGTDHDALGPAEAAGLLTVAHEGVEWRHPLSRAAAVEALSPADRRRAHLAVALALTENQGDPAQAVWHRVDAATGPDEALAGDLDAVAMISAARGAHPAAARAYEVAAHLGTDRDLAAARLGRAGLEAWFGDDPALAGRLLAEALPELRHPDLRWEVALTAGQVWGAIGTPQQTWDAYQVAVAEARATGRRDREVRALASCFNTSLSFEDSGVVERLVESITTAADPDDLVQVARSEAVQGFALLAADRAEPGRAHLDRAMDLIEREHLLVDHPDLLQTTVQAVMWSGQPRRMRAAIEHTVDALKRAGDTRMLPSALRGLSWCDYAGGFWDSAALLADEALDLARIGGRAMDRCDSLVQVSTLEGVRGHTADAVRHAHEAAADASLLEAPWREAEALWCEVLAQLSAHDLDGLAGPASRFDELLRSGRVAVSQPEYLDGPLALALVGRGDEARTLLDLLLTGVGEDARPETHVGVALCRCALEPDGLDLAAATGALATSLVDDEYVFGRGRLALAAGGMTRRLGHRAEARALLRTAEADFLRLGAVPWLARARDELRASGATLRTSAEPEDTLTAAEARVARAAASGLSNKEVAAALFLSPKTVEFHLGRIFRKLQVRSRAELVRAVLTGPYAPTTPPEA